jgi:HK97 family phage major capsid protein
MTIIELREKRSAAWEKAKNFLDSKRSESGILLAEDAAIYDKLEAEVLNYKREIERLERQAEVDRELSTTVIAPLTTAVNATVKPKDDYSRNFWNAIRGVKNSLAEGTDSAGGYLVPDEFERTLVSALSDYNIMRGISKILTTSGGTLKIPVVATKGTASWYAEEATIAESNTTFSQVTLDAYKLGTMLKVSDELLQDSAFNLESYIATEFAQRIGAKEEESFLIGDGTGKPTGIFAATGGGQIGVTTASVSAITFDEVMDLYYSLRAPYRKNAMFITNETTVKTLRKIKDTTGQYIWQPALTLGTPDLLLGRPVYTSIYVPEIAAGASVISFGDYSYYWLAERKGRTFKRLDQLFAQTDQVGFMATERVDGKLVLPEAVKIMKMAVGN